MPASQHITPKSDIEISQDAPKRPILEVARDRLGIAPQHLDPYGQFKAKLSLGFILRCKTGRTESLSSSPQ